VLFLHFYPPGLPAADVQRWEARVRRPLLLDVVRRVAEAWGGRADAATLHAFLRLARGTPWPAQLGIDVAPGGSWRVSVHLSLVDRRRRTRRGLAEVACAAAGILPAPPPLPRLAATERVDVVSLLLTPDGGAGLKVYTVCDAATLRRSVAGQGAAGRLFRGALDRWPWREAGRLHRVGAGRVSPKLWIRFAPPLELAEVARHFAVPGSAAAWWRGVARHARGAGARISYLALEAGVPSAYYR
jgi:hypothetical protein